MNTRELCRYFLVPPASRVSERSLIGALFLKSNISFSEEAVDWLPGPSNQLLNLDVDAWTIRLGRSITNVETSRFCSSSLIGELNEARTSATVLRVQEGRHLIDSVERLAREKLGIVPDATPRSGIVSVLQNCAMLKGEGSSCVVDISGNCRSICELAGSEWCNPPRYVGLFCESCSAQLRSREPFSKLDGIVANSCLHYAEDVAKQMKSLADKKEHSVTVICGSVFAACRPLGSGYDELGSRAAFVNQCLTALRLLGAGDSFACEISDTLTQFTVGIIYILHRLFREISLCPVAHKLRCSPRQYLVCRSFSSFSEHSNALMAHLEKISEVLEGKPREKDVVSILPISMLFSEDFYKFVRKHTTNHVSSQLSNIVDLERLLLASKCTV